MLVDAWCAADAVFPKNRGRKLSECVRDVRALCTLTDHSVTEGILNSENPDIEPARIILKRIKKRDFYK